MLQDLNHLNSKQVNASIILWLAVQHVPKVSAEDCISPTLRRQQSNGKEEKGEEIKIVSQLLQIRGHLINLHREVRAVPATTIHEA